MDAAYAAGQKKVMLVDDDEAFLEELAETLQENGYASAIFSNGTDALSHVEAIQPDIIFLDLKMTGMSGFELAALLYKRKQGRKVPVVAMTGYYTDNEYRVLMHSCGIKRCMLKPVHPQMFLETIETIIANDVPEPTVTKGAEE